MGGFIHNMGVRPEVLNKISQSLKILEVGLFYGHNKLGQGFVPILSLSHKRLLLCGNSVTRPGDIYKKSYRGKYCVGCEPFIKDGELVGDRLKLFNRL